MSLRYVLAILCVLSQASCSSDEMSLAVGPPVIGSGEPRILMARTMKYCPSLRLIDTAGELVSVTPDRPLEVEVHNGVIAQQAPVTECPNGGIVSVATGRTAVDFRVH